MQEITAQQVQNNQTMNINGKSTCGMGLRMQRISRSGYCIASLNCRKQTSLAEKRQNKHGAEDVDGHSIWTSDYGTKWQYFRQATHRKLVANG